MLSLSRISAGIDRFNSAIGRFQSVLLLFAVVLCAGHALSRKLLQISSNGALELQWYLFSCIFLLGAAYTLRVDEHVRIDLLANRWSPKTRIVIDILGTLFFLLPVALLLLWHGWPIFWESWISGENSADYGGLIRWPVRLLLPLGFALLILQAFSELIKRFAQLSGALPLPTHHEVDHVG